MTKTQQLISIPFSALFLQVTTLRSFSLVSQYLFQTRINPIFLEQELSSAVQVRVLANLLLRALNHLQSFFEATFFFIVPRIYLFYFLKKIKINKIKSIGNTTTSRKSGGLLGETSLESSVKELQIVGRRFQSSDLIRSGQIWSGSTERGLTIV